MLEYGWRLENATAIITGHADEALRITGVLESLMGDVLQAPSLKPGPPELILPLESGRRLVTFAGVAGDPEWSVQLPSGEYVHVSAGEITVSLE